LKPEWDDTVRSQEISMSETEAPWLTIPAMLADNLVRYAQRTAIVDGASRISYSELKWHMHKVAAGLQARNLGPGDVVAIWAPNCWQKVAAVVGCWWRGCIVTPIPARGKILDALPILQSTRARLLFTSSSSVHGNLPELLANHVSNTGIALQDMCPGLDTIVDFSDGYSHPDLEILHYLQFAGNGPVNGPSPGALVDGADICEIMFTSGSTGRPKGVLRRHDQLLRTYWHNSHIRDYRTEDRLLAVAEFSHAFGLNGNMLRSLILGATLVIAHSRNPAELAALIGAESITVISAPPSLFTALLRERANDSSVCRDLRLASTGAANVPPAMVRELLALGVQPVITGYGMTECDIVASTDAAEDAEVIATTVGKPEAGLEVQITSDMGLPVRGEAEGELWVRGYAVSPGYLSATGQIEPLTDAQGWLHTGDMGRFTAAGNLQILGRKKDVITIHGYTLYPAEIENLLSQSRMLAEIAVMGMPHAVAGEICVAFIVPADASSFSLKRLRLWARNNVADYKIPGRFIVLERIPLTPNGKVDRVALRNSLDV
jgi:HIP---CoA ligase